MEAIKLIIKDDGRRARRHARAGNLDVTRPISPVEHVVPELAVLAAALVEAIELVIEDDGRRARRHASAGNLGVTQNRCGLRDGEKPSAFGGLSGDVLDFIGREVFSRAST